MRFTDKMLVSRSGVSTPKRYRREIEHTYVDFWTSLETIRAHMETDGYWSQSYTTDFIGALTIDEQLSSPPAQEMLAWLGSDSTLTQRDAADYTFRIGTSFDVAFCLNFMASATGLPPEDFALIAISGFYHNPLPGVPWPALS